MSSTMIRQIWAKLLAQSDTLTQERNRYGAELIRLGMTKSQAAQAAANYVPHPEHLGTPERSAQIFYEMEVLLAKPAPAKPELYLVK